MALSANRNVPTIDGSRVAGLVNNAAEIFVNALLTRLTANGNIVPGGTANAGVGVGVAEERVTGDGVRTVTYKRGTFPFKNSASGDLIGLGDIGNTCYIVDDETVAKTDNSAARKAAGKIINVDTFGVWVEI